MYLKESVKNFLVDQKIEKNVIKAIEERMDKVAGTTITSGYLKDAIGDERLAKRYTEACENDIDLLMFGLPS